MADQVVGSGFDNTKITPQATAEGIRAKSQHGELVVGVRVDALPVSEAEVLAGENKFYPLTLDEFGCLRVRMADGAKVKTEELEVLREIRDVMAQCRDLLMKIA